MHVAAHLINAPSTGRNFLVMLCAFMANHKLHLLSNINTKVWRARGGFTGKARGVIRLPTLLLLLRASSLSPPPRASLVQLVSPLPPPPPGGCAHPEALQAALRRGLHFKLPGAQGGGGGGCVRVGVGVYVGVSLPDPWCAKVVAGGGGYM